MSVETLVSPVTGLSYTKQTLEIYIYYQTQNFMKIEQIQAYSGSIYVINKFSVTSIFFANKSKLKIKSLELVVVHK